MVPLEITFWVTFPTEVPTWRTPISVLCPIVASKQIQLLQKTLKMSPLLVAIVVNLGRRRKTLYLLISVDDGRCRILVIIIIRDLISRQFREVPRTNLLHHVAVTVSCPKLEGLASHAQSYHVRLQAELGPQHAGRN